jgi:hypothetical protein
MAFFSKTNVMFLFAAQIAEIRVPNANFFRQFFDENINKTTPVTETHLPLQSSPIVAKKNGKLLLPVVKSISCSERF